MRPRSLRLSALGVAILVSLAMPGCGSDSSTSPSTSPSSSSSSSPYAGTWKATIDSRRSLTFTVSSNQVTTLSFSDQTLAIVPPFNPFLCVYSLTTTGPVAISGTSFSAPVKGIFGATTVTGTFTTNTAASGKVSAYQTLAGSCNDATGKAGSVSAGQGQLEGSFAATRQ